MKRIFILVDKNLIICYLYILCLKQNDLERFKLKEWIQFLYKVNKKDRKISMVLIILNKVEFKLILLKYNKE